MTVAELIVALRAYPPDITVVLARDSEGNHYSQLAAVSAEAWEPESTYVLVYNGEDDDVEDLVKGPVLWPTN